MFLAAKMSGRGLGHTGGTIDKLEAIDGFHVEIDEATFVKLVNENKGSCRTIRKFNSCRQKIICLKGCYWQINSIPLIASSIMSKKIAAGADAIVLDVKLVAVHL